MEWLRRILRMEWLTHVFPMEWLVRVFPKHTLIKIYNKAKARNLMVGGNVYGNRVIKISSGVVVKAGYGVTPGEAATQHYASQHISRRVALVPRVYRFFQVPTDDSEWSKGYLFMEYIPGKTLEEVDIPIDELTERIAGITHEFAKVESKDTLGQINGGILQGYLWGDDGTNTVFQSINDMNHWLNIRLKPINKEIDLRPYPLVLCHLDLCRRNIILTKDNSICLLDWGFSGFFPRFFEAASASCMNDKSRAYEISMYKALVKVSNLTEEEQNCVELLRRARAGSLRYTFS